MVDAYQSKILPLPSGAEVWCEGPIGELVGSPQVAPAVDELPHYRLMVRVAGGVAVPVPFAWRTEDTVRQALRGLLSEEEVATVWEKFALESYSGMVRDQEYHLTSDD